MTRLVFTFIIAIIVGLLVQGTFIKTIYPLATAPDILLVLVVYIALQYRSVGGLISAFFIGIFADFASGQFIGLNSGGSVIAFCFVSYLANKMYAEKNLALVILTFFCSIAKSLTQALMFILYVDINILSGTGIQLMFIEAILSALVAPIVFWSLRISGGYKSSSRSQFQVRAKRRSMFSGTR